MKYNVINGKLCIGSITLNNTSAASTLFIGDTKIVSLSSVYETPPETFIVGVTVPFPQPSPASERSGST